MGCQYEAPVSVHETSDEWLTTRALGAAALRNPVARDRVATSSGRVRGLAALALAAAMCGCAGSDPAAPNLLLIVVDTLRADHLAAYGYGKGETPHLTRLAREGTRFETAYAPTATTGPTHAGLFTGRFPRSVGVRRNAVVLAEAHETLAERLAAAGWDTAAVVSSFPLHRKFGFAQGFSVYDDEFDPKRASVRHTRFEGYPVTEGFDRRADATTDRALAWLAGREKRRRPFFLFVHYFDPHEPYVAPARYQRRFALGKNATLRDQAAALYDAEVAFTDSEIGRLLAGLAAGGLADDTLVVLTADHGEGLFQHGHLFHDVYLYEEAVRVPLLVRGPGLARGSVVAGPVMVLDLLPTLLELLGLDLPAEDLAGHSLAALLRGSEAGDLERSVVLERREFSTDRVGTLQVSGEQLALRRGRWKYIEAPEEQRRELYDLTEDPGERNDLHQREPAIAQQLAAELARWRAETPVAAAAGPVSPEDRKRLEALGYVD
jgi:arylsulfatase A-like enzyme